ncbi:MAG TPA: SCP-like extracellular [Oscillatoriales cyanobacterium M59_W2019_021]|nr:MAG: SCP-like extracellular [Cyanobacteria bacterium J055]HIK32469.1 SCP-like extracellular [Oscillatoriales cyanobacterium M4454_W2019_049]HIK52425.1 SCP-like extracellular [Oscillatoriales cyanobacterium M59_W2019_021]
MSEAILNAHNQYRAEVDVPPLSWSDALASDAQEWADYLASLGRLQHSENTGQGENLWMGTSGFYSYTDMVEAWGEEQQYFIGGTFPDVSSTGDWSDVGHYTQMVWRETTAVGCGIATAEGNNILVCRYSPPGNFMGEPVF